MTSMWMVQDDEGKFLTRPDKLNYEFTSDREGVAFTQSGAQAMSGLVGGHLVEMVPAKAKVPVSQEEVDVLEKAKNPTYRPSFVITEYSNGHKGGILGNDLEDRLMRAYVNGYTVVEPTKYNVKVPHMQALVYCRNGEGGLVVTDVATINGAKFTTEQIEEYKLQGCERVEINTEDSDEQARDY